MELIKCKMCGGDLHIEPGSTICECEYCGSKQTIPDTNDEKRLKLYERANRLRFNCEFDKSAGVYESIVAEFQTEAEAYWGLLLCKYGIEYVDDPKTGKKIPTCHRSSFDCVLDDNNFELVMENADSVSTSLYREQAKQIEELRKSIIEVSSKEDPYDIFICYKETAEDGERTLDSVLAQDVYDALVEKGYKVFFSRITLEDKLGQEYEPYIFAALNSAKVMLAFGTKYEYYNAVWVKNEWSRFLQLMEAGQKKTLIPCFKNIDAYDMPKEFSKLQALDMDKIGATQDLLRGIDKIFGRDKRHTEVLTGAGAIGDSNALVKRGYFCLEDGEWDKAVQYFDQAMDLDPENAGIHLGLFLAKRKCSNLEMYIKKQREQLENVSPKAYVACKQDVEFIKRVTKENLVKGYLDELEITEQFKYNLSYDSIVEGLKKSKEIYSDKDWKKAERFAKGELLDQIVTSKKQHIEEIDEKIEEENKKDSLIIDEIKRNYSVFLDTVEKKIIDQRYSAEAQREQDYNSICERIKSAETENEYRNNISGLRKLHGYKNSDYLLEECEKCIAEIRQNEKERIEKEKEAKKKKIKKIILCISPLIVVIIFLIILLPMILRKNDENANTIIENGQPVKNESYEENIKKIEQSIADYNAEKNEANAEKALNDIKELKDKGVDVEKIYDDYMATLDADAQALKLENKAISWDKAKKMYELMGKYGYKDAEKGKCDVIYYQADCSYKNGDYEYASRLFNSIRDYKDSREREQDCEYKKVEKMLDEKKYKDVIKYIESHEEKASYKDIVNEAKYAYCDEKKLKPDYDARRYIEDLMDINYPGASELNRIIHELHITARVYSHRNSNGRDEIRIEGTVYGGELTDLTNIKIVLTLDGKETVSKVIENRDGGYNQKISWNPEYKGSDGIKGHTVNVDFYDNQGNLIETITETF